MYKRQDTYTPGSKDIRNCHINIGTGKEITIAQLADKIVKEVDVYKRQPFILELFNAHVTTLDGEVDTTFVAYLDEQKAPWWGAVMGLSLIHI